jgi:hypothetical protein
MLSVSTGRSIPDADSIDDFPHAQPALPENTPVKFGPLNLRAMLRIVTAQVRLPLTGLCALFALWVGPFADTSSAQVLETITLNVARRGHTATPLADGRVLIVGGENSIGHVADSELFDPISRTFSVGPVLATPRTDHSATLLPDGRVLIVGGNASTGATGSTEIFDPVTGAFSSGPSMQNARAGHSATVLADGRLLLAGGDTPGSAEIYDPQTQGFVPVSARLIAPRGLHSAARLQDGRVLIVGGIGLNNAPLSSAELFNPGVGTFVAVSATMATARWLPTLSVLPDGKVQVIGGNAEGSMEIFDPNGEFFNARAILPPDSALLDETLSARSRAALIRPQPQGWLSLELYELLNRQDHSLTEMPQANQAMVAGGVNSDGQVLTSTVLVKSSRATVTTDRTDYAPGEVVTVTGTGWQPGETVLLVLHEDPTAEPDRTFSATADSNGRFTTIEFAPDANDVGRTFTLTAIGQGSGFVAQTVFTDAELVTAELTGAMNDVTIVQGAAPSPFIISVNATGGIACSVTSGSPATATVRTVYTFNAAGMLSSSTPSAGLNFFAPTPCSGTNGTVTWAGDPTPYGVGATVSANALTPANNYTITLSPGAGTTTVSSPNQQGGKLEDGNATTITVHVRLAAPSGLTANGVSQTQINLSWTDNSTGEDNFTIESSSNGGTTFLPLAIVGAGVTTFSHTGLTCGTTRPYRVRATKTTPTGLNSDLSNVASGSTTTCNNPPTADAGGPYSVPEGGSIPLTGTGTDPDAGDTLTYTWDLDNNGTFETAGQNPTFSAAALDGPGSQIVVLKVCDDHNACTTSSATVTINNVPPTATFNAPSSVSEGNPIALSLTSPVDVAADLPSLQYAFDCGDGAGYGAFSSTNSKSCPTTDNGSRPVRGKIKDKDGGESEYTASVTIINVAPTITAVTPSGNVLVGQPVTFTGTATDPSSVDTTYGFSWAWNTGSGFGSFGSVNNNTYVTSYSVCGTYTVQAKAQDKDAGISQAFTSIPPASVWNGNFLPPLKEGMSNLVQKGRVVPVQISFGCGGHLSGLAPEIQLLIGDFVANVGTETSAENVVTESVSNADTGKLMREIDSKYIYNLAIPNQAWSGGQALTVRIRPFGPNTSPAMYILLEIRK